MDDLVERLRAAGCVFAEDEAAVLREAAALGGDLDVLAHARVAGMPLEHVVGWADFAGVRVPVDPGVFVPRPRSELLVEVVTASLTPGDLLIDVCCGSGAIAAAVAARVPIRIVATDSDRAAAFNATRTLAELDARVYEGDLFDGLPIGIREHAAVIAVVAPYVPSEAIPFLPREARDFESLNSLDGGPDGLRLVRRIVSEAPGWLQPGGLLATELGVDQVDEAVRIMNSVDLQTEIHEDDGAVVVAGRRARP